MPEKNGYSHHSDTEKQLHTFISTDINEMGSACSCCAFWRRGLHTKFLFLSLFFCLCIESYEATVKMRLCSSTLSSVTFKIHSYSHSIFVDIVIKINLEDMTDVKDTAVQVLHSCKY